MAAVVVAAVALQMQRLRSLQKRERFVQTVLLQLSLQMVMGTVKD
jgi:hypothetical protein